MALPTITALPATPSRTQSAATFNTNTANFLGAMPTFGTELNTLAAAIDPLAVTVSNNATAADASKTLAYSYSLAAAASAAASGTSASTSAWVSGTTYAQYIVVVSPVDYQTYRRTVAGAGSTDPSADNVNWRATNWVAPWLIKVGNYTAIVNDRLMCNTVGGTFTITLPATPVAGMRVAIADYKNNFGTNKLIVGRNGSLIEGVAEDMDITSRGYSRTLEYVDAIIGWKQV